MNEETTEKVLCKDILLKLDKNVENILKCLLFGEEKNRTDLFNFLTPGKATTVPQDAMLFLMAYLLKEYASDNIQVKLSCYDEDCDDPIYYLHISIFKELDEKENNNGTTK